MYTMSLHLKPLVEDFAVSCVTHLSKESADNYPAESNNNSDLFTIAIG